MHYANYAIDTDGMAQILDSGQAFYMGVVPIRFRIAGDVLPDRYSKAFVEALAPFDLAYLRAEFNDVLSEPEQWGLFLRREILLDDAATRRAVLLP